MRTHSLEVLLLFGLSPYSDEVVDSGASERTMENGIR